MSHARTYRQTVDELTSEGRLNGQNFCLVCMTRQPLRSRHCRHCNRCVARFDQWVLSRCPELRILLKMALHPHAATAPGSGIASVSTTTGSSCASWQPSLSASSPSTSSPTSVSQPLRLYIHLTLLDSTDASFRKPARYVNELA